MNDLKFLIRSYEEKKITESTLTFGIMDSLNGDNIDSVMRSLRPEIRNIMMKTFRSLPEGLSDTWPFPRDTILLINEWLKRRY